MVRFSVVAGDGIVAVARIDRHGLTGVVDDIAAGGAGDHGVACRVGDVRHKNHSFPIENLMSAKKSRRECSQRLNNFYVVIIRLRRGGGDERFPCLECL